MKAFTSQRAPTVDLNRRLERCIEQKTGGRVYCLRVDTCGGRAIIHGHTGSYGVRQLALNAVLEALENDESDVPGQVEVDIDVIGGSERSSTRCECEVHKRIARDAT
jgi:hypothetical protein